MLTYQLGKFVLRDRDAQAALHIVPVHDLKSRYPKVQAAFKPTFLAMKGGDVSCAFIPENEVLRADVLRDLERRQIPSRDVGPSFNQLFVSKHFVRLAV